MALSPEAQSSYLAYLRAIGLEEGAARGVAAQQTSAIQRQVSAALPEINRQGLMRRERIGQGAETRGVFRSGARLKNQAEDQANEQYRVGGMLGQLADRTAGLQADLGYNLSNLARQRAERQAAGGY